MKIVRISGKNLNSLASFDLDFTQPPLAQAALFGLTGPTGAGKSTILDALCLALYRETPRLRSGRSANETPGDGLGANDPRNYLRQGCAQAEAAVEFVAKGQHFRARWQVRRARDAAGGALQADQHVLEKLGEDGQFAVVEDRKSQVIAKVQEYTGLAYEQFSRAVLLAQGDFAALLRADPAERAVLLEKLTGGDIYARIGKQAFAEAKMYEGVKAELDAAIGTVQTASDEDRAEWARALAQAVAEVDLQATQLAAAQAAKRWHVQFAELRGAAARAAAQLAQALQRQAALEPERVQLAAANRVEPLRLLQHRRDDDAKNLREQVQLLVQAQARAEDLAREATRLDELLPALARAVDAVTLKRQQLAPELQAASEWDGKIASQIHVVQQAEEAAVQARALLATADQVLAVARREFEALQEAQTRLQGAADADVQGGRIAALWPTVQADLKRLQLQRTVASGLAGKIEGLQPAIEAKRREFERAQQAVVVKAAAHSQAQDIGEKAELALVGVDVAVLMAAQKAAAEALAQEQALKSAAHAAAQAWQRVGVAQAAVAQATQQAVQIKEGLPALQSAVDAAKGALDQAQLAEKKAQELLGLAAFTAHLQPEAPCPLCGSVEHPVPLHSQEAQALLAELQSEVRRVADREKAAQVALLGAEAELRAVAGRQEELGQRLVADQEALGQLAAQWQGPGAFPPADAAALALEAAAATQIAELEVRCASAEQAVAQAHALQQANLAAQTALSAALQELSRSQAAERVAEKGLGELEGERQRLRDELLTFTADLAQLDLNLAPLWQLDASWQSADAEALGKHLAKRAEEFGLRQEQLHKQSALLRDLDTARQLKAQGQQQAAQSAAELTQGAATQQSQLREMEVSRGNLLGGQAVVAVRAQLDKEESAAREAHQQATQQHKSAELQHQRESSLTESLRAAVAKWREQADQSARDWHVALGQQGLTEPEVLTLLAISVATKAEWQGALQASDLAVATGTEGQRLAAAALDSHGAPPENAPDHAAAEAWEAAVDVALRSANDQAQMYRQLLAMDDAQRLKSTGLLASKAQLNARAKPWDDLRLRIGDAEGKRLRNFAQAIAFSWLVASANQHLAQLRPRYALQVSGPQGLDLLVLDRDQADALRPANTLSGGETFLVSLALALGLSTLASGPTQCDFLLIDEGFGTLDLDTLDTAFSVLEGLQATGRRVGVVTHVPEAKERLGARIEVTPLGNGRSSVAVVG